MFSELQLRNFERYLANCPKNLGVPREVLGAYDAAQGAAAHGFRRAIPFRDFSRGGAFDSSGAVSREAPVLEQMQFLASKLSAEDWRDLQAVLCGGDDEDDEGAEDFERNGVRPEFNELPKNALGAMDQALGRIKNAAGTSLGPVKLPDISHIKIGA